LIETAPKRVPTPGLSTMLTFSRLSLSKLCALGLALLMSASGAAKPETVVFPSAQRNDTPDRPIDRLTGYLSKPAGDGPLPAIIALHGCGGMSERFKQEMLTRWTAWGYVVLVIDSFANHPVKYGCGSSRATSRADWRALDAVGGLRYLAGLPFVDAKRVALLGYSQGATAALDLIQTRSAPWLAQDSELTFAAVVAFYPDCRAQFDAVTVPTLILVGERDDWNPPNRCAQMKERHAGRGAPLDLVVYPDATHAFDWIDLREPRRVEGYLMQYNETAANDSLIRHRAFVDKRTKQ
jgi:dienelactone hydrolase